MASWILAIDESGRIDDPRDHALLGGVLLRERDTGLFRTELRRAIEKSLPGVPWPPHATDLRLVSTRPSFAARGVPDAPLSATHAALKWNLGPTTSTNRASLEALSERAGELPEALCSALDDQVAWDFDQLARVTAALGGDEGTAWVVAAWESAGAGEAGVPRYLRLLDALAERVELCLERQQGRAGGITHDVLIHSSTFGVDGQRVRASDLGRVSSVQRGIRWTPTTPQEAKEPGVHPLLIVADFVCNRLRRVIGEKVSPDMTWSRLSTRTASSAGLAPECGVHSIACALPTVAALGVPQQVLSRRLERGPDPAAISNDLASLRGCEPTWAREQAEAWLGAL